MRVREYCAEINLAALCPCEAATYKAQMMNRNRERRSKLVWAGSTLSYKTIGQLIAACPSSFISWWHISMEITADGPFYHLK